MKWLDRFDEGGKVSFPVSPYLQNIFHIDVAPGTTKDTAGYLSMLKLMKDNGNPNVIYTDKGTALAKYRPKGFKSQYNEDTNTIGLEKVEKPFPFLLNELAHSRQFQLEGWKDKPHPEEDKLRKQYQNMRLMTTEQKAQDWYDKNYYKTPGTNEYNAHVEIAPQLYKDYQRMRDSTMNNMPHFPDGGKVDNTGHAPYIEGDRYFLPEEANIHKTSPYNNTPFGIKGMSMVQNSDQKHAEDLLRISSLALPALSFEEIPSKFPFETPMSRFPITQLSKSKTALTNLKGTMEKELPLSKEEEIWRNIKNIGKNRKFGGVVNNNWLDHI